jgi:hypothetical protein
MELYKKKINKHKKSEKLWRDLLLYLSIGWKKLEQIIATT